MDFYISGLGRGFWNPPGTRIRTETHTRTETVLAG